MAACGAVGRGFKSLWARIKFDYKYGFNIHKIVSDDDIENISSDDNHPLDLFLSMLDAPDSKRQYPKRLQTFFNFLKIEGDIKEQALSFVKYYKYQDDDGESLKDGCLHLQNIKKKGLIKKRYHLNRPKLF